MVPYEEQLDRDRTWAFQQGGLHFEGRSEVQATLRRIARALDDLAVPYAVCGAMAMFFHGYRRFTSSIDILVSREGVHTIHERLLGSGYVLIENGSKRIRDVESGVAVKFLVAGDTSVNRKPNPVALPEPAQVRVCINVIQFVEFPALVEMKLAAGITQPARLKDLADVQEMIKYLQLPRDFSQKLNPFVRDQFHELWDGAQQDRTE